MLRARVAPFGGHNGHTVADVVCRRQVISDIEDAHPQFISDLFEQVDNRHVHGGIDHRNRLIGDQERWVVNKALAMQIRYNCPPGNSFGYFPANS
jgi:hypothetical protein